MKRSFDKFTGRLIDARLTDEIWDIARKKHVTLRELYEASATASVVAARKEVYTWLKRTGKSPVEIGKLFDRASSGILKLIQRRGASKRGRTRRGK